MGITKEQVASAKMLIDKGKPSLQSVEQSTADPFDSMSVEMMVEQCRALILSHPEIIQALNLVPAPVAVDPDTEQPLQASGTGV